MQIKRLLDDREVFVGSKVSTLRSNPILGKPLLTEGVFFLGIEERFFIFEPKRAIRRGFNWYFFW